MAEEQINNNTPTQESDISRNAYDGIGEYNPFVGTQNSGSVFVPPTDPNPFFVPPSYEKGEFGTLKVQLHSDETCEFFQDELSLGFFKANSIQYSPSTTFGNKRIYKAKINGKISLNYYEVLTDKTFKSLNDIVPKDRALQNQNVTNLTDKNKSLDLNFDFSNESQGAKNKDEEEFKENLKVIEYEFDPATKTYFQSSEKNLRSNHGTINLKFRFAASVKVGDEIIKDKDPLGDPLISYDVTVLSNFKSELGDILTLTYDVHNDKDTRLDGGKVKLSRGNSDRKSIKKSFIDNGSVKCYVEGVLPEGYSFSKFYVTSKQTAKAYPNDYSRWREVERSFKLHSRELAAGIVVLVLLEKEINVAVPTINLKSDYYDVEVRESDVEKGVAIQFTTENTDYVNVYTSPTNFIKVDAKVGYVDLYFAKDFQRQYGTKKIIFVPVSEQYGTGTVKEIIVKFLSVNDFPSITQISYPEIIEIPSFSDLQIDYDVEYSSFAVTSVDVDLIDKNKKRIPLFKNLPSNGKFNINLKTLGEKYPDWNGKDTINLIFKPYNRGGEKELVGNEYEILTKLIFPSIHIDEDTIRKTLYDAFDKHLEKLTLVEPEKESKFLTHLANFGNDEQILITTWEEDNWTLSEKEIDSTTGLEKVSKEVKSLLLKLYEPLPTDYDITTTFWITRLVTNSLVETVILKKDESISCPIIKGPNFQIEVDYVKGNSTNFESLDSLILSASVTSSEQLVRTYLSKSLIDFNDLNIEYASGVDNVSGQYLWNNFIHFSSAKERVDNFVYKVQLIETYEKLIASSSTDIANTIHSPSNPTEWTASLANIQEIEKNKSKKEKLLQGLDSFEKFLLTSSSKYTLATSHSLTWPYSGSQRLDSTNSNVYDWYNTIIESATDYDNNNRDFVLNNIPSYISRYEENEELLLFLSMMGQHFDNFYFYTKTIENSRQLGYKDRGKLADRLLYDTLLSLGWDAKNLSIGSKLWKYAFGLNDNGQLVEENPAKKRTLEVWRRLINNLPYLLKHKGSRRGIYALMACYGIPASNLSIFEFGGPNIDTSITAGKLEMQNLTYMLNFKSGSYVQTEWKNTVYAKKPDTIELFIKPKDSQNTTIISGSDWNIQLSGSINSKYGKVIYNYKEGDGTTEKLESSTLPLFNDKAFGISLSRNKQNPLTTFELNTFQADNGSFIFRNSIQTTAAGSNWDSGSVLRIGNDYVGSIDEFRLWNTVLNSSSFSEHNLFPEMINGNHFSSSTDDLTFRLDFEYPKNLGLTNPSYFINVAANIRLQDGKSRNQYEDGLISFNTITSTNPSASISASAYGFESVTEYPYNFEAYERDVVLTVPDGISSRYITNKVRIEEQTLISDLSSKTRSTVKSLDSAPMDSNRIGLFFSPNKELNIDIAKSFGDLNLGDYIGDPSDVYKPEYKDLGKLRSYYFQRFQKRDIYSYLNMVALYEKALFDDIQKMLPARVKGTTGVLIEPHFLERSKITSKKPTGDKIGEEGILKVSNELGATGENIGYESVLTPKINTTGENESKETTIKLSILPSAESPTYGGTIGVNKQLNLKSENIFYEANLKTGVDKPHILEKADSYFTAVGMDDLNAWGFGVYANNGYAVQTYRDNTGNLISQRVLVYIIKKDEIKIVTKYSITGSDGKGDPRGGTETTSSIERVQKLVITPFTGSDGNPSVLPLVTGSIVEVTPVKGYLKQHYKNVKDVSKGLENSKFYGAKNKAGTTVDGAPPVEIFATNPNTLVVNKAGRDSTEPILEVE